MKAEEFLLGLLPLAAEYVPRILFAEESGEKTRARRMLQEALQRQAFEERQRAKRAP